MTPEIYMNKKYFSNQKGFTLIEVVTALAIFSIGLLAIASIQVRTTSENAKSRFATEAAAKAQDQVERLLLLPYDPAAPAPEFSNANNGTRAYSDPTGRYTIDWTVSPPDTPINNAVTVIVSVNWNANGSQKNYRVEFIKTNES